MKSQARTVSNPDFDYALKNLWKALPQRWRDRLRGRVGEKEGVQHLLSHAQECQEGARGVLVDRRGMEGLPQDRLGSPPPLPLILLITNNTLLNLQVLKS
jgi:hypothetical protein